MPVRKFTVLISLILMFISIGTATAAPPAQQADLAFIAFPNDNAVVRGVISITGSATHPAFDRFQVAYAVEPVIRNDAWITIGIDRQDQVVNGELAIWDTRTVSDGSYSLRLRVVRVDGNYSEIEIKQIVVANTQPTETPTPISNAVAPAAPPTATSTPLPPTPTIIIEQPVVDTPTPRALALVGELPTPRPTNSSVIPLPRVNIDTARFKSGCFWGAGLMLIIFLLFGFLSSMQTFIKGFADRSKGKRWR